MGKIINKNNIRLKENFNDVVFDNEYTITASKYNPNRQPILDSIETVVENVKLDLKNLELLPLDYETVVVPITRSKIDVSNGLVCDPEIISYDITMYPVYKSTPIISNENCIKIIYENNGISYLKYSWIDITQMPQTLSVTKNLYSTTPTYNFVSAQRTVGLIVNDKIIMAIQEQNGSNLEYRNYFTGEKIQYGEVNYES